MFYDSLFNMMKFKGIVWTFLFRGQNLVNKKTNYLSKVWN